MNKMSVFGLLVLIATLPACDYCCKKAEQPVEATVVEETVVPVTPEETTEVVDLVVPADADMEVK